MGGTDRLRGLIPRIDVELLGTLFNKVMHDVLVRGGRRHPGPDGVRGEVWRRLKLVCGDVFCDVASLLSAGVAPLSSLNEASAAYLPKVVCFVPGHGAVTNVKDTRPLMLKNSASKMVWSIFPTLASEAIAAWAIK